MPWQKTDDTAAVAALPPEEATKFADAKLHKVENENSRDRRRDRRQDEGKPNTEKELSGLKENYRRVNMRRQRVGDNMRHLTSKGWCLTHPETKATMSISDLNLTQKELMVKAAHRSRPLPEPALKTVQPSSPGHDAEYAIHA